VLIRGAFVISMDRDVGDLLPGDILVEDDTIAAIASGLDVEDAEVVDATDAIAIPGFIDTHRHTWETAIRGVAPDVTLAEYFAIILDAFAPAYRPRDVAVSNYLGALEAVNAGITTLLDWSHINNTPEHADAGIDGLRRAGLRAVYCHGTPNTSLAEWWGQSTREHPEDVRRIRDRYFPTDDGLITLAMATRGPGFCTDDVVRHDWQLARDIGAPISVHVNMGPQAGRFSMIEQLDRLDLLGDDTTYIHCNYLTDDEVRLIAATGGKTSIAPLVEMQMGHGLPPTARLLDAGIRPSMSIDVTTTVPGEMFTQMRILHATHRVLEHERAFAEQRDPDPAKLITARDVLEFATYQGARVCGLEHRTGSLTPGKQADIVLLNTDTPNLFPVTDPVSNAVLQADTSNVDTVIVAGRFLKRDGKLLAGDLRAARDDIAASLEHLMSNVDKQPHWIQAHDTTRHPG
jgi:cytosine/adenosine deaminase-related metal-dependent hydrolase